ncbi:MULTISPECIES: hypothetical protein [Methylobacterium]|nr:MULTISPECIES: hypothetical protein [Methylobacterium]
MRPRSRPPASSSASLFHSGLAFRLGLAAALAGPLWLAIAWTLGT